MSWPGLRIGSDKSFYNMKKYSQQYNVFQSYIYTPIMYVDMPEIVEYKVDKKSWLSAQSSVCSLLMIMPILFGFTLSQLLCQHLSLHSTRRFFMEFLLVALPTICNLSMSSDYVALYTFLVGAHVSYLLWRSGVWSRSADATNGFECKLGKRPLVFTLLRSTAYMGTAAGILAIDFEHYLVNNGKSRDFGATIMDMGIGLFVVTMGLVSNRVRHFQDIKRLLKVVLPLLVLGVVRTLVITMINYHQDEREYGKHLNAFITLGLTKLLGGICTLMTRKDKQLLPLGFGVLLLHEFLLQLGLSDYIMLSEQRDGFLDSNREGLSALPGCIALYLLSMYLAKWYTAKEQLNYSQFCSKLRVMLMTTSLGWFLVFGCALTTGIARVTFNTGYVLWLLSICMTLLLLYAYLFEYALVLAREGKDMTRDSTNLPVLVESLNMNGLTHFMLSNILTGLVNMTLQPKKRNPLQAAFIMMLYLLVTSGVIYALYRRRIRIA